MAAAGGVAVNTCWTPGWGCARAKGRGGSDAAVVRGMSGVSCRGLVMGYGDGELEGGRL